MDTISIIIVVVIFIMVLLKFNTGELDKQSVKEYVSQGALIIDVRSPGEFASNTITKAINIPYEEISKKIEEYTKNKDHIILVYCLSGSRSAVAKQSLKNIGYMNTYNIGTFRRMAKLLKEEKEF